MSISNWYFDILAISKQPYSTALLSARILGLCSIIARFSILLYFLSMHLLSDDLFLSENDKTSDM